MKSFDLSHANQLSVSDAKEYIKRYFYPLASGLHVQVDYDDDEKPVYEIKEDKVIKSVYFNRLPKVIYDFYFKEYDQIKTLTKKRKEKWEGRKSFFIRIFRLFMRKITLFNFRINWVKIRKSFFN